MTMWAFVTTLCHGLPFTICQLHIEGIYDGNTSTVPTNRMSLSRTFLETKFTLHPVSKALTRETLVWRLPPSQNLKFGVEAVGTYRVGTSANAALRYGAFLLVKVAFASDIAGVKREIKGTCSSGG